MVFPTIEFAAFFLVVVLTSWLLMPRPALWKPFMLLVSLLFYAYADWRFVGLLLLVIVGNQAAATVIAGTDDRRRRKAALITAVALNLGLLGWFKYLDFFTASVSDALERVGLGIPLPLLSVALPVGISFYTFMAISYVVDVHQGVFPLAKPIDAAVYLAFFPHLVAGPIVRAREFIPQLARPRDPRHVPAVPALFLIAGGLFKKVLVADFLAINLVDPVFGSPDAHSAAETIVAVYGYAAQIYCDFSGYTDMAIGLAMLLGYRFPQNFDRPYTAASLQEFWRRWHMTLSRWLRDYLYIPLGGSRRGSVRTYLNLMVTMLLGGLWHGASWTFVIWGGIHGTGLAIERWYRQRRTGRAAGPEAFPDLPPARTSPASRRQEASTAPAPRAIALRRPSRARREPVLGLAADVPGRVPGVGVLPLPGRRDRVGRPHPHGDGVGRAQPAAHLPGADAGRTRAGDPVGSVTSLARGGGPLLPPWHPVAGDPAGPRDRLSC